MASKNNNVIKITPETKAADSYLNAILNAAKTVFSRSIGGSFGISPNGKRNYNELFGYGEQLDYSDFKGMYERGGYAKTIVDLFPKLCWRDDVKIKLNDKEILEAEILSLKRAGLFRALEIADIANRIGKYSCLFIGIPDGLDPSLPIGTASKGNFKGLYFNVYEEDGITVAKWNSDPASPRYNMPVLYTLQTTLACDSSLLSKSASVTVHYSRVVHFAEGSLSNKIEGCSSLEAPWNALTNKNKIAGSDAESYYRNSRQKLALEAEQGYKKDTREGADTKLKENVENFQNGFEDTLRLSGMKANMLQPSIVSPRDSFDVNTEDVAGTTRIPVRFLTTKAGGTVTGSEDKVALNGVVADRQEQECTNWLLTALESIGEAGIISLPEDVDVVWPVQKSLNEKEAAETCKNKADAFKSATEGLSTVGADEVLAESVFKAIGLDDIEIDKLDLSEDDDKLNKSLEA